MEFIQQEKTQNSTVTLTVKVTKEELEAANTKAFAQNSKKLNIDGFRKGKAPRKVIEKMYGKEVFYDEAINILYPAVYDLAMAEAKIVPIARPEANVSDMNEDGINYTIVVPVYPKMKLSSYKGITVDKLAPAKANAQVIDAEIESLAKKLSRIETVDREVKAGDTVNFDFEGFVDGVAFPGGKADGHDLEIGSGQFIPGFEDALIGVKADQDLDVNVTFPAEYHSEELAGKDATFKCHINIVKQRIVPEIDDEFAKDASEFDTLKELKADIEEKINSKNELDANNKFEEAVMVALVNNLEGEFPDVMKEQQLDRIVDDFAYRIQMQGVTLDDYIKMNGMTMENFRSLFETQAVQQVKTRLALEVVAREEKLEITDAELEEEFETMAKTYNMELDKVKSAVPADALKGDLIMSKAASLVRENAIENK